MKRIQWSSMSVVWAIATCVVMSCMSYAQEPREIEANVQVGMVSGIGTHGSFGGGIGVALSPRLRGYGDVSYIPLGGSSTTITTTSILQSQASARAINFNLGAQYDFSRSGSMSPYAGFGIGMLHSSSSFSTSIGGTSISGQASSNDVYFNFGGGLRYFVTERWGWKPEMMVFAGSNTYVRLGGGIFYHFKR